MRRAAQLLPRPGLIDDRVDHQICKRTSGRPVDRSVARVKCSGQAGAQFRSEVRDGRSTGTGVRGWSPTEPKAPSRCPSAASASEAGRPRSQSTESVPLGGVKAAKLIGGETVLPFAFL
jgi:hypothetical protein